MAPLIERSLRQRNVLKLLQYMGAVACDVYRTRAVTVLRSPSQRFRTGRPKDSLAEKDWLPDDAVCCKPLSVPNYAFLPIENGPLKNWLTSRSNFSDRA